MTTQSNRDRAVDFLRLAASGQVDAAFEQYVADEFSHHNPYFPADRSALRDAMAQSAAAEPNKSFEVQRVIDGGDIIAVHSKLERADKDVTYAVVHILRFADGKLVELWDIGQEVPPGSPNALGMF